MTFILCCMVFLRHKKIPQYWPFVLGLLMGLVTLALGICMWYSNYRDSLAAAVAAMSLFITMSLLTEISIILFLMSLSPHINRYPVGHTGTTSSV